MKTSSLALVVLFSIGIGPAAIAKGGPCKRLKAACVAGGYTKGAHKEGKGLKVDCMAKIKNGEQVPGVTYDAADVAACKERVAKRKAKHGEK